MKKLIIIGVLIVVTTILALSSVTFHTVSGQEMGIRETWAHGVVNEVLPPKNYFLFPSWSQKIINYDMTLQKYELTEYTIKSVDNQEIHITSKVLWRRDPKLLVTHHTALHNKAEDVDIQPSMISAINLNGTDFKAIDAYSGAGLVALQKQIENTLKTNPRLISDGIIIESFVVEKVRLNDSYVEQIEGRQLAELRQSRAVQEQLAAMSESEVAKAKAMADLNTIVVGSQRDAQVRIIKSLADQSNTVITAQAAKEQQILAAEASKQSQELEADGKRASLIAIAEGNLAQGKAEAESKRLLFESYNNKGADAWVKVQVAANIAQAFSGVKGYVPQGMTMNILTSSYEKAVDAATGNISIVNPDKQ